MSTFFTLVFVVCLVAIPVFIVRGLRRKGRKRLALYSAGGAFVSLLLVGLTAPNTSRKDTGSPSKPVPPVATPKAEPRPPASAATASPAIPSPAAQSKTPSLDSRLIEARETMGEGCINDVVGSYPDYAANAEAVAVVIPPTIKGDRVAMLLTAGGQKFTCAYGLGGQDTSLEPTDPVAFAQAEAARKATISQASETTSESAAPVAATPAGSDTPGLLRIVSDGYFGCTDRKTLDDLVGYLVQKDTEAFRQGFSIAVLAGVCTPFKAGEPVQLEGTAVFAGLIKVRRRGELAEYWTNLEAAK